jgi:hypothetical protein
MCVNTIWKQKREYTVPLNSNIIYVQYFNLKTILIVRLYSWHNYKSTVSDLWFLWIYEVFQRFCHKLQQCVILQVIVARSVGAKLSRSFQCKYFHIWAFVDSLALIELYQTNFKIWTKLKSTICSSVIILWICIFLTSLRFMLLCLDNYWEKRFFNRIFFNNCSHIGTTVNLTNNFHFEEIYFIWNIDSQKNNLNAWKRLPYKAFGAFLPVCIQYKPRITKNLFWFFFFFALPVLCCNYNFQHGQCEKQAQFLL